MMRNVFKNCIVEIIKEKRGIKVIEMKNIIEKIRNFRDERNWNQFHTPENLAKSISIEAAELLENYQWQNPNVDIENVKDEIADIFMYALLFIDKYDFDLEELILKKLDKNKKKYPISKAFGKSDKYDKL